MTVRLCHPLFQGISRTDRERSYKPSLSQVGSTPTSPISYIDHISIL